jgi:hypothetical protein
LGPRLRPQLVNHPLYQVVLRAERHRLDPVLRLKQLLKHALRTHALRCVSIFPQLAMEQETMKISSAFPSKYLRADDVDAEGGQLRYTIRKVVVEEVGQDRTEKPVCYFREAGPGLVVNRTNAARLAASLGDETDNWIGKQITLETERVPMGGKVVNSIRVRVEGKFLEEHRPPSPLESQIASNRPLARDILDDEIPF